MIFTRKDIKNKRDSHIVVPEGYEIIDDRCFYGFHTLSRITLPSTLKHLNDECFSHCDRLTKIIIPINVLVIVLH